MPPNQQHLNAVLSAPASDAPRLAYAAAFENQNDPRAKFIRLQIAHMAAGNRPGSREWWECKNLLAATGPVWASAVAPLVQSYTFERGFVGLVKLSAQAFITHAPAIMAAAPVMHLDIVEAKGKVAELMAVPQLATIRSLSLAGCGLDDHDVQKIASSPHLRELRWLSLMDNRAESLGADALARSTTLPNLEWVSFVGNPFNPTECFAEDTGVIVDRWMPPEGEQFEARHGYRRWLHYDNPRTIDDIPPDRFRLALKPLP